MVKKAVILVSGGLDSTTCLAIARSQKFECYTLCFDYGQRHRSELRAAAAVSSLLGARAHKVFRLSLDDFGGSALTDASLAVPDYTGSTEIPITYVPARNTIFLAVALGYAEMLQAHDIFIGVSSIDYSHYPDCRPEYIAQFQKLASLATKQAIEGTGVTIHAPLLLLTKGETISKGLALGVDYKGTVSCYQANEEGEACGSCDPCMLRKKGFAELNAPDPTRYDLSKTMGTVLPLDANVIIPNNVALMQ
ncbi:MAG: 7-cyano-7-deazaguanine synthase QueC [Gammaproteobacteria bacterium]|nr:7-cyano-7-deazaguanine synthase QueC [Gammaproteobacteria bacterium]